VSVSFSDFDTHADNFGRMRQLLPIVDHALHALVTDLDERGLLGDVAIVVWGEFGRTPRINKQAGRDHWPEVSPALLAGSGLIGRCSPRPIRSRPIPERSAHSLGLARRRQAEHVGRPVGVAREQVAAVGR